MNALQFTTLYRKNGYAQLHVQKIKANTIFSRMLVAGGAKVRRLSLPGR